MHHLFFGALFSLAVGKPLVSLVMIVKNEARGIVQTISSVRDSVDYYSILDTGSTDATVSLIRQTFGKTPGKVHNEPFVDFSTTRNRAIELEGKHSEFALMLSGDEVLHNGAALRRYLETTTANAFNVHVAYGREYDYLSTRAHRTGAPWSYVGRTHEVMRSAQGTSATMFVPEVYIEHSLYNIDKTVRFEEDLKILLSEWSERPSSRTAFYLGQTYQMLQRWTESFAWYEKRWEMLDGEEERWEARYRMGYVGEKILSWPKVVDIYLSTLVYKPDALYDLAYHYYKLKEYETSYEYVVRAVKPSNGTMFVRRHRWAYLIPDLLGTVAWFVNEMSVGRAAVLRALEYKPNDPRLLKNLAEYEAPGEL